METEDIFGTPLESVTGYRFLPQAPEVFTYDADGNLLSDGRWNYTWDAENRLIRVETRADLPSHMPRKRIDYQYDFMGRRFMMRAYEWDGAEWVFYLWERYLYDGWTLAGREGGSVNGQRTQHYLWGLDESGTLGGAGDVGGLLMIRDLPSGKTYHPTIDANGNVIALWDADTAEVAAYYDYDPFGKTVRATGPAAEMNPFRFSTKYQDHETGFYYYGYRYYSPSMGRFLNRDPIEEEGGLNLYGFVNNDPVNYWDYLGLSKIEGSCKQIRKRLEYSLSNWANFRAGPARVRSRARVVVEFGATVCDACCNGQRIENGYAEGGAYARGEAVVSLTYGLHDDFGMFRVRAGLGGDVAAGLGGSVTFSSSCGKQANFDIDLTAYFAGNVGFYGTVDIVSGRWRIGRTGNGVQFF